MAKRKEKKEATSAQTKEREFLDLAMKRLKKAVEAEDHNRSQAIDDLKFLNGEQWDQEEKNRRKRRKRPIITINMLPDKVDRVVGDMRQNRARVKVRPADSQAQPGIAKIREGIIAKIEYQSNASAIYDYAGGREVECGHGAWRVLTRYCRDNPFVQEIYLEVIKNSFTAYLDPAAKDHCKADAKWGFILDKMSKEEFEETYPDAEVPGNNIQFGQGLAYQNWWNGELVTVAEYFVIVDKTKTLCLMKTGVVLEKKDADSEIARWERENQQPEPMTPVTPAPQPALAPSPAPPVPVGGIVPPAPVVGAAPSPMPPPLPSGPPASVPPVPPPTGLPVPTGGPLPTSMPVAAAPAKPKPEILKEKEVEVPEVRHYVITACGILSKNGLDGEKFPGKYIPIIVVTGKERNIEGKDYIRGLVRDAKDPQRLVNYWNTSAAEIVALAPKAPWIGTAKQFEGYEEDYAAANQENFPFLKYNPDPQAQGPPQRNHAGDPPVAVFTQIQIAEKNFHTVVGIGPDMRDVAPDASQKALIQRQKPAELATFPFVDNLSQAIAHGGRVINEMIPEVYDTERDVSVMAVDGTETYVPINTTLGQALRMIEEDPLKYRGMDAAKLRHAVLQYGEDSKFNDVGRGLYDTVVDVGPSYATQRQESVDNFVMLAQTNPRLWQIAGDLIVKNLDVQGAEELADRLRKTLPPGLITLKPGETPPKPMPPSPQVQLLMSRAQTEQLKQKKEDLKIQVEMIRLYKETKETDVEIRKEILKVLAELHAPMHPADQIVNDETGPGGTPLGMPGKPMGDAR